MLRVKDLCVCIISLLCSHHKRPYTFQPLLSSLTTVLSSLPSCSLCCSHTALRVVLSLHQACISSNPRTCSCFCLYTYTPGSLRHILWFLLQCRVSTGNPPDHPISNCKPPIPQHSWSFSLTFFSPKHLAPPDICFYCFLFVACFLLLKCKVHEGRDFCLFCPFLFSDGLE